MRCMLLAVLVAACGGGASLPGADPEVRIRSRLCNVQSSALLVVNVTYDVTLDVGQAFTAAVDTGGFGTNPNSSFSCFEWNDTFAGSEDVGCQRDDFEQPATVAIEHFFNATLPDVPVEFSAFVSGSALDEPLSTLVFANASESVPCAIPPPP